MSRSVDDRVVRMQFDNQKFERNVQTTLSTLDKLKGALNFDKEQNSLKALEHSARSFDLGGLVDNIQRIADRFSAFGIVGDQVIRRLTDGFMGLANQATKVIKSLSVDQISAGWGKYEQKTASVQTIMNATGKSIDEVNTYLNKLMWFSDETSYGFTDMTAALGQLTSAGGDIDKLIPMITGIANATAYAGKGTGEFSRAIYNLNQSYSAGNLQYMDWKSLELAGIASKELKQTFIDTGIALGKIKDGQVTIANFGQTLKDKWADTEVMEAAFGKFGSVTEEAYKLVQAGDFDTASDAYAALAGQYDEIYYKAARSAQEAKSFAEALDATRDAVSSGWMKTFELIFGNYEEAKQLWTDMANSFWEIFASGADSRNELLEEWHKFTVGGYEDFADAINNVLGAIISAKDTLSDIVHNILPELDSTHLQKATEAFKQFSIQAKIFFSGELKDSDDTFKKFNQGVKRTEDSLLEEDKALGNVRASNEQTLSSSEKFYNIIRGITNAVDILRKGLATLKNSLSPLFKVFSSIGNAALTIGSSIGNLLGRINDTVKITDGFKSSLEGVSDTLSALIETGGQKIAAFFDGFFTGDEATDNIGKIGTGLREAANSVRDFVNNSKLISNIKDSFKGIGSIFSLVGKAISGIASLIPNIVHLFEVAFGWVASATGAIGRFFTKVDEGTETTSRFGGIMNFINKVVGKISDILAPVTEHFSKLFDMLSADNFEGFKNIIQGIASGGITLAFAKVASSLTSLTKTGEDALKGKGIIGAVNSIKEAISGFFGGDKEGLEAKKILNLGIAIGILAGSMLLLSTIDSDALTNGIIGMSVLLGELLGFMKGLTIIGGGKGLGVINKLSTALMKIASGVIVLALALKILASIKVEDLGTALLGLGGIFLELTGFLGALKLIGGKKGIGGIKQMSKALKDIGAAMIIFGASMKIFASMSWEEIDRGLLAIGGLFAEIALFVGIIAVVQNKLGKINFLAISTSLMIMASAMVVLAGAVAIFSLMSWESLAKGGAAIGGFMLAVGLFGAIVQKNVKGLLAGTAAIVLISPALLLFAGAMAILGSMGLTSILKALVALGGGLAMLSWAIDGMSQSGKGALVLMAVSTALMIFVPAMALLGAMPIANIGKALLILGGSFAILYAGVALMGPMMDKFNQFANVLLKISAAIAITAAAFALFGIAAALLAVSGAGAATAFIAALEIIIVGLADILPRVLESVVRIILAVVDALVTAVPGILEGVGKIIYAVLDFLEQNAGPILNQIVDIILIIFDVIESRMGELVDKAIKLIVAFLNALADGIRENTDIIIGAIKNLLSAIIEFVLSVLQELLGGLPLIGKDITNGLEDAKRGIRNALAPEEGKQVGSEYGESISSGAEESLSTEKGLDMGSAFSGAVGSGIGLGQDSAVGAAKGLSDAVLSEEASMVPEAKDIGYDEVSAHAEGMTAASPKGTNAASDYASNITSVLNKYIPKARQAGEDYGSGFAAGILSNKTAVEDAAYELATTAPKKMRSTLQIKSPSKVGAEIGMYLDYGFADGILAHTNAISDASEMVSNTSISSLRTALSTISDIVANDISSDPVIKPVMDLSDVEAGAKQVGNILNNQNGFVPALGLRGLEEMNGPKNGTFNTKNYGGVNLTIVQRKGEDAKALTQRIMQTIEIETEKKEAALA